MTTVHFRSVADTIVINQPTFMLIVNCKCYDFLLQNILSQILTGQEFVLSVLPIARDIIFIVLHSGNFFERNKVQSRQQHLSVN